ncbi:hypothetical protein Hypma_016605 [Hypsizygus marmoreus]|uniref:Uncharacterized protein n=1 Tax=Hypsizygus marmoreus TaxID=39966 RepID=A0A369J1J3_HYPMA|nr:hypothetical protein Hypma_016605 [Hypsizygus marmoreus]
MQTLEMHKESARRAITQSQDNQVHFYDNGQKAMPIFKKGDKVLINPHFLEWKESKEGGAKLVQRRSMTMFSAYAWTIDTPVYPFSTLITFGNISPVLNDGMIMCNFPIQDLTRQKNQNTM